MKLIRVALVVQRSIPGEFEKNLSASLEAVCIAAGHKAEIVVFPEMNLTGYISRRIVNMIPV